MFKNSFLLFILFVNRTLWAAACCSSSGQIPTLILGDDQAQITLGLAQSSVVKDADTTSIITDRESDTLERNRTLNLTATYRPLLPMQLGLELPMIQRQVGNGVRSETGNGIGDVAATVTYEPFEQTTHSDYLPRFFVFTKLTAPTGNSIYDSKSRLTSDVYGKGFWQSSFGFAAAKTISLWDILVSAEGHRIFGKGIRTAAGNAQIEGGFGASSTLQVGINPGIFRFGLGVSSIYESALPVSGAVSDSGDSKFYWTSSVNLGARLSDIWSLTLNYNDDTLFGGARNTTLSRAVMVNLQHRFPL